MSTKLPLRLRVDFGVGTQPVTGTSLPGGTLHIPVAWHTVSLYTNILTASALQPNLNLTACLAARLFSGITAKWGTPEVADINPGLSLVANVDTTVKLNLRSLPTDMSLRLQLLF
ncbi:hypothetical protein HaLaN_05853 [Haematococcus lacustris]|uniref:Uncharacterized protein n=1 Tax=Haematococcus lacustris TaxID=44745 RepID=A0A699YU77_HAELA|nr:hypothetical protein HaLaN_05853 [Haematococcus lacustris]